MKEKKVNVICKLVCIILVLATIAVVILGNNKINKQAKALVNIKESKPQVTDNSEKKKTSDNTAQQQASTTVDTELNVYEKIKNKKNINMLIIGDNIAASEDVEDKNKWYNILTQSIATSYGVKVDYKLLTGKSQGVLRSLDNYIINEATNKYDFVVICVGEYDINLISLDKFQSTYETLIRKIKQSNAKCDIIPVIESSIQIDKTYPAAIKKLADYYELNAIDEREVYNKSNISYKKLTGNDKVIPNAEGYKLYASSIFQYVSGNVSAGKDIKNLDKDVLFKIN
jgi:hypothetical protein